MDVKGFRATAKFGPECDRMEHYISGASGMAAKIHELGLASRAQSSGSAPAGSDRLRARIRIVDANQKGKNVKTGRT